MMRGKEIIAADIVARDLPGGISYEDDPSKSVRIVRVCGNDCIDRIPVIEQLLAEGVEVVITGCQGSLGGCAMSGVLPEGAYAQLPQLTETEGYQTNTVVIVPTR